ncbi:hypothetical protein [Prochlorothrix hollandica]|nr:hypothetical protein [Prochlorothrix hollandica]
MAMLQDGRDFQQRLQQGEESLYGKDYYRWLLMTIDQLQQS